jgi:hypothetical protein
VERVITEHGVSERFACRVLGQCRSTQRNIPKPRDDAATSADIIPLAIQYGRRRHHYNTVRPHSSLVTSRQLRRCVMAGFASRPGFAGHADVSATTNHLPWTT